MGAHPYVSQSLFFPPATRELIRGELLPTFAGEGKKEGRRKEGRKGRPSVSIRMIHGGSLHHPRNIPTPWLIPIERRNGGGRGKKTLGEIYRPCEKKKRFIDRAIEKEKIFFFFHATSLKNLVPRSIENRSRFFGRRFTTGFWDKCGTTLRALHACTHVCTLRAAERGTRKHIWPQIQGRTINFV